jgi:hypothetical protein
MFTKDFFARRFFAFHGEVSFFFGYRGFLG